MFGWKGKRPLVSKTLTIEVEMRDADLLAIGIPVRRSPIEPGQNDCLPPTCSSIPSFFTSVYLESAST